METTLSTKHVYIIMHADGLVQSTSETILYVMYTVGQFLVAWFNDCILGKSG